MEGRITAHDTLSSAFLGVCMDGFQVGYDTHRAIKIDRLYSEKYGWNRVMDRGNGVSLGIKKTKQDQQGLETISDE